MAETVSTSTTLAVPTERVWAVLSDYFALASWASAIDHSSPLTDAAAGMGASRRVAMGSNVIIENVVDWKPPSAMAYEIVGLPPVVKHVENRWEVRGDGTDTTVTLTCSIEPGPKPPMKVAAKAVARRIGKVNESLVADLARAAAEESP